MALVKDGALLWRRGLDVKDVRSNAAVDEDTVFEAASYLEVIAALVAGDPLAQLLGASLKN